MSWSLWKGYLRWRHSKGFGVHSPYAYKFITEVLNPGCYGYYAYNDLLPLSRGRNIETGSAFRNEKFLIRLAHFLHTKRIISYGIKSPGAQIVARALKIVYYNCDINSELTFKKGDLLIVPSGSSISESIIKKAIEQVIPILAEQPVLETRMILESPIEKGLSLIGKKRVILIPREEMEFVSYEINL